MTVLTIDSRGFIELRDEKRVYIRPSAVGIVVRGGCAYSPENAVIDGDNVTLTYPCGEALLKVEERGGYHKITVLSVPEESDSFIFGPYETPGRECGEVLGAAWHEDGAISCIQSLMPKVFGGMHAHITENKTDIDLGGRGRAAAVYGGKAYIQCSASDFSRGTERADSSVVLPLPAPDGIIDGAAVALIGSESADELIGIIEKMELAEGLPHPTFRGSYAKTDRRATNYYLIMGGGDAITNEQRLEYAGRAGINCVYFSSLFSKWGHFTIDESTFPGGLEGVRSLSDHAATLGVDIGAHTLSNFIHTFDEYVTPIPHKDLLISHRTALTRDISEDDTELYLDNLGGFEKKSNLNTLRIGDEIIRYSGIDKEKDCVTIEKRGEFGTKPSAHKSGDEVGLLADHDYMTLFPNIYLQGEMAECIGRMIRDGGIHRLSFDGLEGCNRCGVGEYGRAEFVRKVFEVNGSELICDASTDSHYLWHAMSYFNWGEPWYDPSRRGGSHAYRAGHISYFKRNLIPPMLGWYNICTCSGRYEATPPENMEFILSRAAAFDAGLALSVSSEVAVDHGRFGDYLDLARLWGDFRIRADIPDDVREKMQEETGSWHIEPDGDGWILTQLVVRSTDLDYTDRSIRTESIETGYRTSEELREGRKNHSSSIWLDYSYEGIAEKHTFRLRVGEPGHGLIENLEFRNLKFTVTASDGDYLEYDGDMSLYHYDKNFNLKQVVIGEGSPLPKGGYDIVRYSTDLDTQARYILTTVRKRREFKILPKR